MLKKFGIVLVILSGASSVAQAADNLDVVRHLEGQENSPFRIALQNYVDRILPEELEKAQQMTEKVNLDDTNAIMTLNKKVVAQDKEFRTRASKLYDSLISKFVRGKANQRDQDIIIFAFDYMDNLKPAASVEEVQQQVRSAMQKVAMDVKGQRILDKIIDIDLTLPRPMVKKVGIKKFDVYLYQLGVSNQLMRFLKNEWQKKGS